MRVLQWNAARGLGGPNNAILRKVAVENGARVCLLQEMVGPKGYERLGWREDSRDWTLFHSGRAAILVGQGLRATPQEKWYRQVGVNGAALDAVAVEVVGMGLKHPVLMVSVYRDQSQNILEGVNFLRTLLLEFPGVSTVVGGDFNVHAEAFGAAPKPDGIRSDLDFLVDDLMDNGGGCANTGQPTWLGHPTTTKTITPSHIDGTIFISNNVHPIEIRDWRVGSQEHSDHVTIHFTVSEVGDPGNLEGGSCDGATPPLNWFQFNRKALSEDMAARFSVSTEALARGEQGGLHLESATAFASRVLGEIQSAALSAGLIKPWKPRPKKDSHLLFGWTEACEGSYRRRALALKDLRAATSRDEKDSARARWAEANKDLKADIASARRADWQHFCSEINSETPVKEVWSRLRRVAKTGKGQRSAATPMMRDSAGNSVPTAAGQAQLLTDHWAARSSHVHPSTEKFSRTSKMVIETEYENILDSARILDVEPEYGRLFGTFELDSVLAQLPRQKAAGWDGIPYELLAALGPTMRARVLLCLNGLWVSGGVPDNWKEAILIPLAKKDSPTKSDDFRPVSLLVCLCKILESLIHKRLEWVLDGRVKHLPPNDLGFRRHSSAVQQVLRAVQAAHEAWARGDDLALVLLDVDKAFDTLWGPGLIVKMHRQGVRGKMLLWIDNYLKGRKCRAVVEGALASERDWDLGIGQGGILGPLFFVVYFSDLPVLPESGGKYADDGSVWHVIGRDPKSRDEAVGHLQLQLDAIYEWARTWRITFSVPKTVVVLLTPIKRRQSMLDNPIALTMGGTRLKQVMEGGSRLLGIWIDPHLRFTSHFSKVGERAWRRIHVLRSISGSKWGADRVSLSNLYTFWNMTTLEKKALLVSKN